MHTRDNKLGHSLLILTPLACSRWRRDHGDVKGVRKRDGVLTINNHLVLKAFLIRVQLHTMKKLARCGGAWPRAPLKLPCDARQ